MKLLRILFTPTMEDSDAVLNHLCCCRFTLVLVALAGCKKEPAPALDTFNPSR